MSTPVEVYFFLGSTYLCLHLTQINYYNLKHINSTYFNRANQIKTFYWTGVAVSSGHGLGGRCKTRDHCSHRSEASYSILYSVVAALYSDSYYRANLARCF